MVEDPICGMQVDEEEAKFVSEHEDRKFYFCSANCKRAFDEGPHR